MKIVSKLYDVEYVGVENIPAEGGFIIASNHVKALDPVFIALGVKDRQIHFMGKKELFEKPIIRDFLKKANGFPIVRGGGDKEALDYAERVALDSWYVRNWSVWLDIMLLWRTFDVVIRRKGAY